MQITCERKALIALAGLAVALAGCGGSSGGDGAASTRESASASPRPATVVVPQLVGLEQTRAHRIADRRGLAMSASGYVGKYGNGRYNIDCVKVLSQSPVAGERRPAGATIWVIEKECTTPTTGPNKPAGME
jgi:hypothetical protein